MAVVVVQLGQCGNQLGERLWENLADAAASTVSRTASSSDSAPERKRPPPGRGSVSPAFFAKDGYARAVLADAEPKVVRGITKRQPTLFRPGSFVAGDSGRGNCWTLGYCGIPKDATQDNDNISASPYFGRDCFDGGHGQSPEGRGSHQSHQTTPAKGRAATSHGVTDSSPKRAAFRVVGKDQREADDLLLARVLRSVHDETARADAEGLEAIIVIHSLAGGTGSGFGSAVIENLRHFFVAKEDDIDERVEAQREREDWDTSPPSQQQGRASASHGGSEERPPMRFSPDRRASDDEEDVHRNFGGDRHPDRHDEDDRFPARRKKNDDPDVWADPPPKPQPKVKKPKPKPVEESPPRPQWDGTFGAAGDDGRLDPTQWAEEAPRARPSVAATLPNAQRAQPITRRGGGGSEPRNNSGRRTSQQRRDSSDRPQWNHNFCDPDDNLVAGSSGTRPGPANDHQRRSGTRDASNAEDIRPRANPRAEPRCESQRPAPSILHEDLWMTGAYGSRRKAMYLISICVAPRKAGETAVQGFNTVLTMDRLMGSCDAVIVLRNDGFGVDVTRAVAAGPFDDAADVRSDGTHSTAHQTTQAQRQRDIAIREQMGDNKVDYCSDLSGVTPVVQGKQRGQMNTATSASGSGSARGPGSVAEAAASSRGGPSSSSTDERSLPQHVTHPTAAVTSFDIVNQKFASQIAAVLQGGMPGAVGELLLKCCPDPQFPFLTLLPLSTPIKPGGASLASPTSSAPTSSHAPTRSSAGSGAPQTQQTATTRTTPGTGTSAPRRGSIPASVHTSSVPRPNGKSSTPTPGSGRGGDESRDQARGGGATPPTLSGRRAAGSGAAAVAAAGAARPAAIPVYHRAFHHTSFFAVEYRNTHRPAPHGLSLQQYLCPATAQNPDVATHVVPLPHPMCATLPSVLVVNQAAELVRNVIFPLLRDAHQKLQARAYLHAMNAAGGMTALRDSGWYVPKELEAGVERGDAEDAAVVIRAALHTVVAGLLEYPGT